MNWVLQACGQLGWQRFGAGFLNLLSWVTGGMSSDSRAPLQADAEQALRALFAELDTDRSGGVSWAELREHGLLMERMMSAASDGSPQWLTDARTGGWSQEMDIHAFREVLHSALEHVFVALDTDHSQMLESDEQRQVWRAFGVEAAFNPQPPQQSRVFVNWVLQACGQLGWQRFGAGFLNLLRRVQGQTLMFGSRVQRALSQNAEEVIRRFFSDLDSDHSGTVSWSEFERHGWMLSRFPNNTSKMLSTVKESGWQAPMDFGSFRDFLIGALCECHKQLDTDLSGFLEPAELHQAVKTLNCAIQLPSSNGALSKWDFVEWILEGLQHIPWNVFKDGFLRMLSLGAAHRKPVVERFSRTGMRPIERLFLQALCS